MTGILKVDQWKDSGDNALMTSDGAGNLTSNTEITVKSTTDTPSIVVNNTNDGKARMTFQENGTNRLEIGLYGGIVSGTSGATVIKAHEPLIFYDNSGETFRSQSGQILLGTTSEGSAAAGDVVLGGGIFIGGNANANKLDDYEEGTWTPTFGGASTDPSSVSWNVQSGTYTKVGNKVFARAIVYPSSFSGGSGNWNVRGLPFTANSQSSGSCFYDRIRVQASYPVGVTPFVENNTSYFQFAELQDASDEGIAIIQVDDLAGNFYLNVCITYTTNS